MHLDAHFQDASTGADPPCAEDVGHDSNGKHAYADQTDNDCQSGDPENVPMEEAEESHPENSRTPYDR